MINLCVIVYNSVIENKRYQGVIRNIDFKVKNLENNGRSIPNQFLIYYTENGKNYKVFQSYKSMILKFENDILVEVGAIWNYSQTTGKYRNLLTDMNKKEFEKMLKNNFEYNENTQSYKRK